MCLSDVNPEARGKNAFYAFLQCLPVTMILSARLERQQWLSSRRLLDRIRSPFSGIDCDHHFDGDYGDHHKKIMIRCAGLRKIP